MKRKIGEPDLEPPEMKELLDHLEDDSRKNNETAALVDKVGPQELKDTQVTPGMGRHSMSVLEYAVEFNSPEAVTALMKRADFSLETLEKAAKLNNEKSEELGNGPNPAIKQALEQAIEAEKRKRQQQLEDDLSQKEVLEAEAEKKKSQHSGAEVHHDHKNLESQPHPEDPNTHVFTEGKNKDAVHVTKHDDGTYDFKVEKDNNDAPGKIYTLKIGKPTPETTITFDRDGKILTFAGKKDKLSPDLLAKVEAFEKSKPNEASIETGHEAEVAPQVTTSPAPTAPVTPQPTAASVAATVIPPAAPLAPTVNPIAAVPAVTPVAPSSPTPTVSTVAATPTVQSTSSAAVATATTTPAPFSVKRFTQGLRSIATVTGIMSPVATPKTQQLGNKATTSSRDIL